MKYAFKLNDRVTRYDQVHLYQGHEIGLYGYFSKGEWTVMAHIDGDTRGYYENFDKAIDACKEHIEDRKILGGKRQEFIDWARAELARGKTELSVVYTLKNMNTFYLWVFDHLSTTHLDHVLDVEAWAILRSAKQ